MRNAHRLEKGRCGHATTSGVVALGAFYNPLPPMDGDARHIHLAVKVRNGARGPI